MRFNYNFDCLHMNDDLKFIEFLMKDSLKKQDQAVNDMKNDIDGLRNTVERSFDISIPKPPQRSTLLVHPDDMKKKTDFYNDKGYKKKYYH